MKWLRRPFFWLIWLCCLELPDMLVAQQVSDGAWGWQSWKIDDGLPDNNVSNIQQLPDGVLLIATYGGMVRFDGLQMNARETEPGVGRERIVRTFLQARDGGMWMAVGQRRIVWRNCDEVKTFTPPRLSPSSYPRSFCESADGALWISYSEGEVARIHKSEVTMFGAAQGLPGSAWCKFAMDKEGQLWGIAGQALLKWKGGRFDQVAQLEAEPNWQDASCVWPAHDGGLWLSAGLKWYRYQEERGLRQVGMLPELAANVSISVLFEDRLQRLWAGLYNGNVYLLEGEEAQKIGSVHHEIRVMTDDHENNLWVGASESGVWRLRPRVFEVLATANVPITTDGEPDLFAGEAMSSITQDKHGTIWTTGNNGYLFRRGEGGWARVAEGEGWLPKTATCIAAGGEGVWIGTRGEGVHQWTEEFGYVPHPFPEAGPWGVIRVIWHASNGDVWAAIEADLWRLREGQWKRFSSGLAEHYIQTMAEDTRGVIWAGTSMGQLLAVEGEVLTQLTPSKHGDIAIRGLLGTPDGALWIGGSQDGLIRYQNGVMSRVGPELGLAQSGISHLVLDKENRLWCGSSQGVFFLRYNELAAAADRRRAEIQPVRFSRSDGISGVQSSRGYWPNSLHDQRGRIWLNLRTGPVIINTDVVQSNPHAPPVIIEEVRVDDEVVALPAAGKPLIIEPQHRSLEISFAALSYRAPENVSTQHQLIGLDQGWNPAGQDRRAMYSRLYAGDYTFRVIACNNDGVWNRAGATLMIYVKPFFWQTLWFRILVGLLFGLAIASIARVITKRRMQRALVELERQAAVERERTRIARDMHDELGASLTQIAIAGRLAQLDPAEQTAAHLAQITDIAQRAVTSLDEIVWAVDPHNDTLPSLVDYVSQHAVDFLQAAGLQCEVNLPEGKEMHVLPSEFRHQLFLAVKEALNNVVKHSQASRVILSIHYSGSGLSLEIEDNGRGLDGKPERAGASGLQNMRERLRSLGGTCQITTLAEGGTRLVFDLPWPEARLSSDAM